MTNLEGLDSKLKELRQSARKSLITRLLEDIVSSERADRIAILSSAIKARDLLILELSQAQEPDIVTEDNRRAWSSKRISQISELKKKLKTIEDSINCCIEDWNSPEYKTLEQQL